MSKKRAMDDSQMRVIAERVVAGSRLCVEFIDGPFRGDTESTALRTLLDACAPDGQAKVEGGRRAHLVNALDVGHFVGNRQYFFEVLPGFKPSITHAGNIFNQVISAGLVHRMWKV